MDKFIQIDFAIPTLNINGFGERQSWSRLEEGAYTMWAQGQDPTFDNGTSGNKATNGVHPFALI